MAKGSEAQDKEVPKVTRQPENKRYTSLEVFIVESNQPKETRATIVETTPKVVVCVGKTLQGAPSILEESSVEQPMTTILRTKAPRIAGKRKKKEVGRSIACYFINRHGGCNDHHPK